MAGWRMAAAPRSRRWAASLWDLVRMLTPSQFKNTAQVSRTLRTSLRVIVYAFFTLMVGITTPGWRMESRVSWRQM
eukprot:618841-Lingulodinium_polyedra.AAC.1